MAGRECAARFGILHELEVLEVGAGGELVMPVVVAVVHQHPDVLVDELEHAGTFHGLGSLLQGLARLAPLRARGSTALGHERTRGHLADAAVAFVLVEGVVLLVDRVIDDVHVDGRLAAVKEVRRVALQVGKVLVRVGVKYLIVGDGPVVSQQRKINERAALGAVAVVVGVVPERLGGPHAGHVRKILALVLVGEVYGAVFPVDKVAGAHEHHAAVACPSFGTLHVGIYHVEPAVGRAQHVRVAESLLDAHGIGRYYAVPIVHGSKVVAVVAECVVDVFVVIGREIRKKVVRIRFVPVDGDL